MGAECVNTLLSLITRTERFAVSTSQRTDSGRSCLQRFRRQVRVTPPPPVLYYSALFSLRYHPDEDTVPGENHANPNEIGTISVQVFVASSWRRNHNPKNVYGIQDHPPAVVDERAKKATDHCVS